MSYLTEHNLFIFLLQVLLLLGFSRGLGEMFRRWKQPALTAEILVGILLGATVFGRLFPNLQHWLFPNNAVQNGMLETVCWLGVFFFLLETGLEMDFSSAWRYRNEALKIAIIDIIVPMAIAFVFCLSISDYCFVPADKKIIFSLFMATVMSVSSMPIAARVLHDLNLSKTDLGFIVMSALAINDIIGWFIFTLLIGFFINQSTFTVTNIAILVISLTGFVVFCLTVGRRISDWVITKIKQNNMPEPASSLTFISLLGLLCGLISQKIGIQALFGFFIAGVMAGEARALSEKTRQVISQMVYALFVPLFFASLGLRIDFLKNFDLFLVVTITSVGIFARFIGAWLGAFFAKIESGNRSCVAVAHTAGGTMEIVIAIPALHYGLISEQIFVAIVLGAIISSVFIGPALNYFLKRRRKVSILEFFSPRALVADLKTSRRDEAIRKLCVLASEQPGMADAELIYDAVLRREIAMGTAIEEGIAVPHARINVFDKPLVVFGRSPEGIEWNSPDGQVTKFIFLILTPTKTDDIQVQLLCAIAKVMSNSKYRDEIIAAGDSNMLWQVIQDSFASHSVARKVS